jgi:CheY-like chemotaxis protein
MNFDSHNQLAEDTRVPVELIARRRQSGDPPIQTDYAPKRAVRSAAATLEQDSEATCFNEDYVDALFTTLGWNESPQSDSNLVQQLRPTTTRPWVLCIDDDKDFTDGLRLRLESKGVEVVQAFAGMSGYRSAYTTPAQAIILDHEMPNGNGEYVLRRLKENPITCQIPVIVLTGNRDRMLERTMYSLGAARFLTKPVEWKTLWAELSAFVS